MTRTVIFLEGKIVPAIFIRPFHFLLLSVAIRISPDEIHLLHNLNFALDHVGFIRENSEATKTIIVVTWMAELP